MIYNSEFLELEKYKKTDSEMIYSFLRTQNN